MTGRTVRTPRKRKLFLSALRETGGNVTKACEVANISRVAAYEWRVADSTFALDWESAIEEGTDELEQEARRRAVEGVKKPVFYKGEKIGFVNEYSDTLLIFLLKARRPERYRERFDVEIKDARKRAEIAIDQMMREAGVDRASAIELLKPHIPQISELLH